MAYSGPAGAAPAQRSRFGRLSESAPVGIFEADRQGALTYVNKRWCETTGLTPGSALGTGWFAAVHPGDTAVLRARWDDAVLGATALDTTFRIVRGTGDVTVRCLLHPIPGTLGAACDGFAGSLTDATEFMHLSRALDASREEFRALAEAMPNLVWSATADGTIDYFNRSWLEYTGLSLDSVNSVGDKGVVHPDDLALTWERWRAAVASGEPYEIEYRLRSARDRVYRWFLARAVPLRTDDGTIARWIGTATDIDTQKRASDNLRRTSARLRFIAAASELLLESLDVQTMFARLTAFIVSELADFAVVLRIEPGNALRTVSAAHRNPAWRALVERVTGERPLRPEAELRAIGRLRRNEAFLSDLTDRYRSLGNVWEYLASDLRELNLRSSVTVPLHARGETIGALVAYWSESPHVYEPADLPLFIDLGRRTSIAVAQAQTFDRERRIAEALQHELLPQPGMLPQTAGMTLNALYRPSSREADVGGDWYDALMLDDGTIVISVGDVTGSGIHAAGLMGKLRQALGMAALYERDPARLLDAVDYQLRARGSSAIVTAFIGFIDPEHRTLCYANAGHPHPFLRRRGEVVELASDGLPLGLRNHAHEGARTIDLVGAELLVLYTDGLTEASRDIDAGEAHLRNVMHSHAALRVRNAARFISDACLNDDPKDDVAVLTVAFGSPTRWTFDAENARAAHDARDAFVTYLVGTAEYDERAIAAAELAFGELIGNVVRHAPGPIDVQIEWAGDRPFLHVIDRGRGFECKPALPSNPLSEGGRGLYIISQVCDAIRVERIPGYGAHVTVELRLRRRKSAA